MAFAAEKSLKWINQSKNHPQCEHNTRAWRAKAMAKTSCVNMPRVNTAPGPGVPRPWLKRPGIHNYPKL